jgi:hypothetical protein
MHAYHMASESVRQLARDDPETFRRVAEMRDDDLRDYMLGVLDEVRPTATTSKVNA